MPVTRNFLGLDLGASSGRAVIGRFDGERLALEEIHRFANGPVRLPTAKGSSIHWDSLDQFAQVKAGIAKAAECCGKDGAPVSVGIDTWGVDYGLLDAGGELLGNGFHYRDERTVGMPERVFEIIPREEVFRNTGIQFMDLNTLYQLFAARGSAALDKAQRLLFTPDLMNYWLSGRAVNEYTIASTSQCLEPFSRNWAYEMLARLAIPTHIFGEIVQPGTVLGPLLPWVAEETGIAGLQLVAVGCHDTASAVAAVPVSGPDSAFVSSGTWSILGVESPVPVVNETALAFNFTNEGGVCDTIRLMKNITGLWLIQECRRQWTKEGQRLTWEEIVELAKAAPALRSIIDVDDEAFIRPGDMPARIRTQCERTGQAAPQDKGAIARTVFESIALKYRRVLDMTEELTGKRTEALNIVGGGTQNRLLSQFAANAIGRPVITGPIEATAVGNILIQMLAMGAVSSLAEGREVIRRSFPVETFEPQGVDLWDEAYQKFCQTAG
jgi:rhamnulokinase